MKKIIIYSACLLLSHFLLFVAGSFMGKHNAEGGFGRDLNVLQNQMLLAQYVTYRDISYEINNGNIDQARCNADLSASTIFDVIGSCISDNECGRFIEKEVQTVAPELRGKIPLVFKYIKSKDGVKSCASADYRQAK